MSKYSIGLTVSSWNQIEARTIIGVPLVMYPNWRGSWTNLLHTSWTWENTNTDGALAHLFGSIFNLEWSEAQRMDIWSVSIFWPQGISEDDLAKNPRSYELLMDYIFGDKETEEELSLTIMKKPLTTQIRDFNQTDSDGFRFHKSTLREMWFVDIYKQALFERRMPKNANFSFTSYDHSRTAPETFMGPAGLRVL